MYCNINFILLGGRGGRGGRGGLSESQQRNKGVLVESQGKRTTFNDDSD